MSTESFHHIVGGLSDIATILALVIGSLWTYRLFIRRREDVPHIEFTVDVNFVGMQDDQWLVEVLALLENKGQVKHSISDFTFDLRCLSAGEALRHGGEVINYQLEIPQKIKEGSWMPRGWDYTFIEPGIRTRYSFITSVPVSASFVLVHGRFFYSKEDFHTADRLIKVPVSVGASGLEDDVALGQRVARRTDGA
jgi:hypothetical protein